MGKQEIRPGGGSDARRDPFSRDAVNMCAHMPALGRIADDGDFSGVADAPGRIKGRCIGHRVTIEAPPELVWDFIADFTGWGVWNPLYPQTSGVAEEGEKIDFTLAVPGCKLHNGQATVHTVRPEERLEFGMSSLGGLLKVFRFIELDEISPVRCTVSNGEIVGGLLGRTLGRALAQRMQLGLEDMNLALKVMAERKWRGMRG